MRSLIIRSNIIMTMMAICLLSCCFAYAGSDDMKSTASGDHPAEEKEPSLDEKKELRREVTLYERDGLRIKSGDFVLAISIQGSYEVTSDDARALSSDALFSASTIRQNKPYWTEEELRGLIREEKKFDILYRLRLRVGSSRWIPMLDLFYQSTNTKDAQISDYYVPDVFNDVSVEATGGALEWAFGLPLSFDMRLRGEYQDKEVKGLIETLPEEYENVDSYTGRAVFSRPVGSGKLTLELTYAYEDIEQDIATPDDRERRIMGGTLRYQHYSPDVKRGFLGQGESDIFIGVKSDEESWSEVDAVKNDYFIGFALKKIRRKYDVTLQPTLLTYNNKADDSMDNAQYRTNLILTYWIKGEDNKATFPDRPLYLSFLNVTFPMSYDVAVDGIDDFENYKAGVEINIKMVSLKLNGTTFLASARYDYQRFYNLDKDLDLFNVNINMGF